VTDIKRFFLFVGLCLVLVLPTSAAANSDLPDRVRLGVVVATEQPARERIEPFRRALEEITDLPVDLFLMPTMADGIEALAAGRIDYIRLSPSGYAASFELCKCVEPLATAGPDDFPARFYAIMIAKRDGETVTLENLKDMRLGVGAKHAVTGYRVPLVNLAADGINAREYFQTLVEVRDPVEGIRAVLDGRVHATLGWSSLAGEAKNGFTAGTLNEYYVSGGSQFEDLDIVWRSAPIPYSAHTVRTNLPDVLKRAIRAGLMDLRREDPAAYLAIEPDLPGGFEPVVHSDYRPVLRTFEKPYAKVIQTDAN
jgi:phosphonate transport system substrate-binding protein